MCRVPARMPDNVVKAVDFEYGIEGGWSPPARYQVCFSSNTLNVYIKQLDTGILNLAEDGTIKQQKVLDNSDDLMPIGQHASAIAENQFRIPMLHFRRLGGMGNESRWGIVLVQ
ncbi:hypothetical protein [Paraflavitalea sp. CAU 1676]|uniref:hypothetical protein n=1 Tax=Paraflavitalea sp. CAU 1676 TaxID=3032598 RepID=UPI0023DA8A2D|nr:hypothetical protein [Paraflavitalea sp. CAU 1676]MDF2188887.1 hypothetical protein [Paraflavitalea sp. CAU 1676]